jgi:hypothetical protein
MEDPKNHWLLCDCYSHSLFVEKDDENNRFFINLFERRFDGQKMSWKERIRWCFHILKNGTPFTDMIIVKSRKAKDLADFINNTA